MASTIISCSNSLSLDEVISRLARHLAVDGVLLIGSTGQLSLTSASDYDMIVVLNEMPAPFHVALTWIGGRLTDVIFFEALAIRRILEREAGRPG